MINKMIAKFKHTKSYLKKGLYHLSCWKMKNLKLKIKMLKDKNRIAQINQQNTKFKV
jgi:hypothetical protein